MASTNTFQATVESLFKGMDAFLSSKTIVGEPIQVGESILLPLADVSFGVGAGAFQENHKQNAGGGMGGKISPSAILIVNNAGTRIVNVKGQDALSKILDMIPDLINRFTKKDTEITADEMEEIIHEAEKKVE